ncbi:MAG: DUF5317 family protein [Microthrixaceae bacterium]
MALVPTLLALGIGMALGIRWGGRVDNLLDWRPPLWQLLVAGVVLTVILDIVPWGGGLITLVRLVALCLLLAFAVVNLRVGGMVLVAVGLGLNLFVTLINWGRPVSRWALEASGAVEDGNAANLVVHGGRTLDGGLLGLLGDTIPLPWGQVISIGDILMLVGLCLVTASVVRRYEVAGPATSISLMGSGSGSAYRSGGARGGGFGGPSDYRSALDALGRGPAPRRGPGLHPSRLGRSGGRRRRGGTTGVGPGSPPR